MGNLPREMKFIAKLLMIYIFVIVSAEIYSLNESRAAPAPVKKGIASMTIFKTAKVRKAPFKNPMMNLLAGIKNVLFSDAPGESFKKCFPQSWSQDSPIYQKEQTSIFNHLQNLIVFLVKGISKFLGYGQKIPYFDYVCDYRDYVKQAIEGFLSYKKEKKRLQEEDPSSWNQRSKYAKRRMREEFIIKALKKVVGGAFDAGKFILKSGVKVGKAAMSFVKNKVLPFITKSIKFIVEAAKKFGTFIKDFVMKIVGCVKANPGLTSAAVFTAVAASLKNKTAQYAAATVTGLMIPYLGYELLGYACQKKENETLIKHMDVAIAAKDKNEKAVMFGQSLAGVIKLYSEVNKE